MPPEFYLTLCPYSSAVLLHVIVSFALMYNNNYMNIYHVFISSIAGGWAVPSLGKQTILL